MAEEDRQRRIGVQIRGAGGDGAVIRGAVPGEVARIQEQAAALVGAVKGPLEGISKQIAFANTEALERLAASVRPRVDLSALVGAQSVAAELAAVAESFRPMEVSIGRFRLVAILKTAGRAIDRYTGKPHEPVPTSFNRHASAHRVGAIQYTRPNALTSLMLVVSVLRELDFWAERDRES